ncbi:MAG TPA: CusA/CzcA family heavy metal efflux RND transporter [Polyangiaceae bacterium]|nr:CusA/CzcA family heavy metal efflux RND transporter [Polyangiaceae bacterium]
MKQIVWWAAQNPVLALMIAVAFAAGGVFAYRTLPIDAVPDVTNTQVQVVTRAPALSATEVEVQITQPIEREMAGIPGLVQTRSISKLGISLVTLVFSDDTDIYFARAQVNERLDNVRVIIPPEIGEAELGPIATGLGEIFMFELKQTTPNLRSAEELRTIVEWQIGLRLRQVRGVVDFIGFGGTLKQYRVLLDPGRLAAHGISIEAVRRALESDNAVSGGGYVERDREQVVLRADARFRGLEDIAHTVVRTDDQGVPLTVGQLGEVDTGPALRHGAMTQNGAGEIVGGSVLMLKGANSREVVHRVKAAIDELTPYLPRGVKIHPYYDRADFIDDVLGTVAKNLGEGAIITVACLLLTLGSIRAGFLVAGAIPFSMLVGFIGLKMIGYSGNVMSLGAVDFGIVVEGAVLSVEHAMTHGKSLAEWQERKRSLVHAMAEVTRPAVFGVVITLLVFLPLASLEDVEGRMFRPVVYSLCFMLTGALLYAFVVIPAVGPWALRSVSGDVDPWLTRKLKSLYAPALERVLRAPAITLAVVAVLTFGLLYTGSRLGADFLPRIFEGTLAIDVMRPPSTALSQAIDLSARTEATLLRVPEVLRVVTRIGRPEGAADAAGAESSDCFIILKPRSAWRPGVQPEALVRELSEKVNAEVPGTINSFTQPIEMRVNDLIAGARGDVVVKVFGDDLPAMMQSATQIRRALQEIPGAADVKMEMPTGLPSIQVQVDRTKAARLGVAPRSVLNILEMARAGQSVGRIREGERVFDLVLRVGNEATLVNQREIGRLPVETAAAKLVPLQMVSDVKEERTVVQVGREQLRRRLLVQANVRGRDMVGFVADAQKAVAKLNVPSTVELKWGGQFENFIRARDRLILLVPLSMLVIAVMLYVTFQKVSYVVVTLLNLPFAIAGGAFALWARGLSFSIPAGVGFIALCGVSVITGIVMTTNLVAQPMELEPPERVRLAALASLRARISTALVAAVGFIPAAIATGTGAEVQRPLATVVIGGLIASMLFSLPALPAMLLYVAKREAKAAKISETRPHVPPVAVPA